MKTEGEILLKKVLIIDHNRHNWFETFEHTKLSNGEYVQIDQASVNNINFIGKTNGDCVFELNPDDHPIPFSTQDTYRKFKPDLVLVKKINKNLLFGLQYANIPVINSIESIYMNFERPLMFGGLKQIKDKLGQDHFPLIDQTYFANYSFYKDLMQYPLVMKAGAAHAGYGKMQIYDYQQFQDICSVIALHGDYFTSEPFINVDYDFRIQKIGQDYRVLKRKSKNWKANVGLYTMEIGKITETYKMWADECSRLFGGMDILAIDALHTADGEEYIIELNDCLIGFPKECEKEDMNSIKKLVLDRIESLI